LATDQDCGYEFKKGSKSEMFMTIQFEPFYSMFAIWKCKEYSIHHYNVTDALVSM